ncbi:MAG: rhodanese-like domain-containing protein [Desulfobulbaceae bacterium]|uniref:Rhodanese-like domain-containing protein n=1 Tax=Candidatus Desulfobia pelagia TaxID=2841692 RepID=A0A8J6TDF5_9BACT|nr:rhodanese-like domain-containing protein [Candidatus Desulfobia pelagia]
MKKLLVLAGIILCVFAHNSYALERFTVVSTEEMQQMLADRIAGKTDFLLVNTLDEMIYRDTSLPGSINIPLGRIDAHAHKLGQDKEKLIVTY